MLLKFSISSVNGLESGNKCRFHCFLASFCVCVLFPLYCNWFSFGSTHVFSFITLISQFGINKFENIRDSLRDIGDWQFYTLIFCCCFLNNVSKRLSYEESEKFYTQKIFPLNEFFGSGICYIGNGLGHKTRLKIWEFLHLLHKFLAMKWILGQIEFLQSWLHNRIFYSTKHQFNIFRVYLCVWKPW